MNDKPKILLVGNHLSGAGFNPGVCESLAGRLRRRGWQVQTTSHYPGRLARLCDMLATVWQARHDYDLAHVDVYSGRAFLWAEAVCRLLLLAGKPYIVTLRGGNLVRFARRRPRRMARLLCGAAAVTTPSRFLFEQLAPVDSEVNRSARSSSAAVSSRFSFGPFGSAALATRRSALVSMPNWLREPLDSGPRQPPGSRDEPIHRSPADFGSTDQPINRSTAFRLIPNPIDVEAYQFRPRRSAKPRLVWLRAFHRIYEPELAVTALAQLVREFPAVRLTMIGPDKGDGSLARTQRAAERCGLTRRIDFTGAASKSSLPALLDRGDIFLNTSRIDNTPVSVLEAMAGGLCIVSTSAGGMPFLLRHECDALLTACGRPAEMAAAVRRLLCEPTLAGQLSQNARRNVEPYDWSAVLPQWERLFVGAAKRL
jgi:glycosyltransferase involved in cell wall biosynthesis